MDDFLFFFFIINLYKEGMWVVDGFNDFMSSLLKPEVFRGGKSKRRKIV